MVDLHELLTTAAMIHDVRSRPEDRGIQVDPLELGSELVQLVGVAQDGVPTHPELSKPAQQRVRLLAVSRGAERLIGEYTFNHSPWAGQAG